MTGFTTTDIVSASKFLGLVLRHQPDVIGLSPDAVPAAFIDFGTA